MEQFDSIKANDSLEILSKRRQHDLLLDDISNLRWNSVNSILCSEEFLDEIKSLDDYSIQPTLLHVTCSIPSVPLEVIKRILDTYKGNCCLIEDEDGSLPIHIACSTPGISPQVIQTLFQACPKTSFMRENVDGELPIYLLLQQKHGLSVFNSILEHLPKKCFVDDERVTSLVHEVCTQLLPESIMSVILDLHPEILSLQNRDNGDSIAHVICSHKDSTSSAVRMVLSRYPNLAVAQDYHGNLPLHVVNSDIHGEEIIRILLTAYPHGVRVFNEAMETPFSSRPIRVSPSKTRAMIEYSSPHITSAVLRTRNGNGMLPTEISFYYIQQYLSSMCNNQQHELTSAVLHRFLTTNPLLKNMVESLFHVMRKCCYNVNKWQNDVEKHTQSLHDPSFFLGFPLFTKLMLQLYPQIAFRTDCNADLPLHVVSKFDRTKTSRQCSMCRAEIKSGIYFWFNSNHQHCTKCNSTWKKENCQTQVPLIGYQEDQLLKDLLSLNPNATKVKNSDGCFPLHLSLRAGKSWFTNGVREMFESAPEAILERDGDNFYPFMLAAENCDLSTLYEILRNNPDQTNRPKFEKACSI